MHKTTRLALPFFLLAANAAWAGQAYLFTMNTSSVAGETGSIDFELTQGAGADQSLDASVYGFSSNGSYVTGSQVLTGDATGGPVIPGGEAVITANNSYQESDDLEGFTYGTTLSFMVDLDGPALTSSDGLATSPYEFVFTTYSDPAGTIVNLGSDPLNGAGNITVSDQGRLGAITVTAISPDASITASPEPDTIWLLACSLGLLAAACLLRRGAIH